MESSGGAKKFRATNTITELSGLNNLIERVQPLIFSEEDIPKPDVRTRPQASAIVASGYDALPGIYHTEFLDGIDDLIDTYEYASILEVMDRDGNGPWRDWMAAIDQKRLDDLRTQSHAFVEVIRDLFDGFLSLEERLGVAPPDHETVAPLVIWGAPEIGPYTWPAHWYDLGIKTATVSLPPAYRHNIALWAALGHEVAGHDILAADDGLLEEIQGKVRAALLAADLEGEVIDQGHTRPMSEFAADYWSSRIDETASDICGVLNLGPAAAVGLAALFIPLGDGKLSKWTTSTDSHPIDITRLWLASDLIGGLRYLSKDRVDGWVDRIDKIESDHGETGNLELWGRTLSGDWVTTATIPREQFRPTAKIVAETIAFEQMTTLENRSLADINTWTTLDEELADSVIQDLLAGENVEIHKTAEAVTYAAHVLSGGVLAMCEADADIDAIHDGTIKALSDLYEVNPTWGGLPFRLPRDPAIHIAFPIERRKALRR